MGIMRRDWTRHLPALVIVAAIGGCAPAVDGPPEIRVDRSACAHCTMLISEPRYAAAYRIEGAYKSFDDVGCLLNALADERSDAVVRLWFRDVRDDAWITEEQAMFVRADSLRTPMAGGIVATAHVAEWERLVAKPDATAYASFDELRAAHTSFARQERGRPGR